TAIRTQNLEVAPGRVGQPPAGGHRSFQLTADTLGRLHEPEQFSNIIVKANKPTLPPSLRTGMANGSSASKAASNFIISDITTSTIVPLAMPTPPTIQAGSSTGTSMTSPAPVSTSTTTDSTVPGTTGGGTTGGPATPSTTTTLPVPQIGDLAAAASATAS